jgi:hypothetical protein
LADIKKKKVKLLKHIVTAEIKFEESINRKAPKKNQIIKFDVSKSGKKYYQFEIDVFNFLYQNAKELGIKSIFKLENSLIDGLIILTDDTAIAVEIKYALNWNKSNVARSQILSFNLEKLFNKLGFPKPKAGIIIFNHFSNDWAKTPKKRSIKDGWLRFYQEQNNFDFLTKIHILQLKNNSLLNCGLN